MKIEVSWGQLALVLNQMDKKTDQKQEGLNKKRDEYQTLFELAPCYITVQDKNLRLIRYNREFADKFSLMLLKESFIDVYSVPNKTLHVKSLSFLTMTKIVKSHLYFEKNLY